MQDEKSIYRVTMEALEDLSNDGVVYAELRFAPLVHCQKGLTPIEVVDSVVNGIKDGKEIVFYSDSSIFKSIKWKNNFKDGESLKYYKNGKIQEVKYYSEGLLNGEYINYFPNGIIKIKGNYKNGIKVSVWEYFDKYSKLINIQDYK